MSCTESQWLRCSKEISLRHSQGFSFIFQKTCVFTSRFHDEAPFIAFEPEDKEKTLVWRQDEHRYNVVERHVRAGRRCKPAVLCVNE